jgi:hypothetical protein
MHPWNNWIHCTGSTYGTWLRGDARGWRARHHREHVDGDYRNPPAPGVYDEIHERSRALMPRDGVGLDWDSRVLACRVMLEALRFHLVEVADFCVGKVHWHSLTRFYPIDSETWRVIRLEGRSQDRDPRHLMGIAKKRSARALSDGGLVPEGGVWARGCGRRYIKNEQHFSVVANKYIPDHAKQGAAVYSILFGKL